MSQTLSATAPEGWVSFDEARAGRHVFLNATISDGKPEEIAYLTPDKELKQGKDVVQVFKFNPTITPWLRCEYSGTTVVLSKPLDHGYKECRVTLDHVHNNQQTKRIDCQ